jgi:hypothetical protein
LSAEVQGKGRQSCRTTLGPDQQPTSACEQVRYNLNKDVEWLGTKLKVLTTPHGVVPMLVGWLRCSCSLLCLIAASSPEPVMKKQKTIANLVWWRRPARHRAGRCRPRTRNGSQAGPYERAEEAVSPRTLKRVNDVTHVHGRDQGLQDRAREVGRGLGRCGRQGRLSGAVRNPRQRRSRVGLS